MANEQNTEALTRKGMNFEVGDNNGFTVYAQSIDPSLIDISKCLLNAGGKPKEFSLNNANQNKPNSKAKPEYIITYKSDPSTILVIECKSNTNKHSSNNSDPSHYIDPNLFYPKDYAVDGVLYYSYFLKNNFNVIALAVSGNEKSYKVNEYYWVKGQPKPIEQEKTRNIFLTPQNYWDLINNQKLVKNFSYIEIKEKAIEFNEHLRNTLKIEPSKRIMFIAGCLLALKDPSFQKDYSKLSTASAIINLMFGSIQTVLDNHNIPTNKIQNIINSCQFIKNNSAILNINLQLQGSLLYFLKQLDLCIIPMINNNTNHQDALGLFYHEFIKYTAGGSGNELGIVLTPPHLCDFMCELADIGENDYVIDTCCGTGSFLISAMKHMFNKPNVNVDKISEIKKNQLYGIEVAQDIFTIAVTNMIIRGDGQSHIYNDDCFNLSQSLNDVKFSVGLINPPYSQKDHCELEFVETMLDKLTTKGRGVVVVPMACAIGTKFKDVREKLFEKHTLKAVFSMPDDIFYPVGTNVCVMVWEAHVRHESSKKTYFGYYKDDGFKKKKKLGRVDQGKWESIKKDWVDNYLYKKVIIGKTALKPVNHNDEWLCEAYMETDYSLLSQNDFLQTVNDYCAYLIKNSFYPSLSPIYKQLSININPNNWGFFKLSNYFNPIRGFRLTESDRENGTIPFVTAGEFDNGVKQKISNALIQMKNCITIDMFCNCFYQNGNFSFDDNIIALDSKVNISKYAKLFISVIISKDKYRYQYGRQYRLNNFNNHYIKLPAIQNQDGTYSPDWQYMENYIKSLPYGDQI